MRVGARDVRAGTGGGQLQAPKRQRLAARCAQAHDELATGVRIFRRRFE
jgi:hypothetical protein